MTSDTNKTIAFFDLDGTLTARDTLFAFIRFAVGDRAFATGMMRLAPMLIGYKLGQIPNDEAKARMLGYFFEGMAVEDFVALGERFASEHLEGLLRPKAKERLAWHKRRGDTVVVVTASMRCWVEAWCRKEAIELIATEMAHRNGRLLGSFATPNCYGSEKVVRIRQAFDLGKYGRIYAYGDSPSDRPMLALAHRAFYKPFR